MIGVILEALEGVIPLNPAGTQINRRALLAVLALANGLLFSQQAFGHWWEHSSGDCHYHLHESEIEIWKSTSYPNTKQAAIDDWGTNTDIIVDMVASHGDADVSVLADNYGDTDWSGLATLEDTDLDWDHCGWVANSAEVDHGHSRYNTFMGWTSGTGADSDVRGVLCQEIGHVFGLDHSHTYDCMGKTYWADNDINVTGPHNWDQINDDY